jgi:hypothetical protein
MQPRSRTLLSLACLGGLTLAFTPFDAAARRPGITKAAEKAIRERAALHLSVKPGDIRLSTGGKEIVDLNRGLKTTLAYDAKGKTAVIVRATAPKQTKDSALIVAAKDERGDWEAFPGARTLTSLAPAAAQRDVIKVNAKANKDVNTYALTTGALPAQKTVQIVRARNVGAGGYGGYSAGQSIAESRAKKGLATFVTLGDVNTQGPDPAATAQLVVYSGPVPMAYKTRGIIASPPGSKLPMPASVFVQTKFINAIP